MPAHVQTAILRASAATNPAVNRFLRDTSGASDTEPIPDDGMMDFASFQSDLASGQFDEVLDG